jgi:hypothetical protein
LWIFYAKLEWTTMKRRGKWSWFDAKVIILTFGQDDGDG